jgi:hypothetical protein
MEGIKPGPHRADDPDVVSAVRVPQATWNFAFLDD